MNPPEKLFFRRIDWIHRIPTIVIPFRTSDTDIEYRLAPVWHDAVKDPPKENGFILVCVYVDGVKLHVEEFYYNGKTLPEFYRFWMPLPEPPKEGE